MAGNRFVISVCEQFAAALTRGLTAGALKPTTPIKTTKV